MNCIFKRIWILTALLADAITPVVVQFAMPMCAPPMFPMPAPMPIIAPALCPLPIPAELMVASTTTTSATTEMTRKPEPIALAVPVPVPMPMPMPIPVPMVVPAIATPNFCQRPPPKPKNCPPCPPCVCKPSCTPSFYSYCSPCHMKCRCRNQGDAPEPLPPNRPVAGPAYGMHVPIPSIIGAPPVVIVPFPPPVPIPIRQQRRQQIKKQKYSSCSEDSTESRSVSSSEFYLKKSRRNKRKRYRVLRRNHRSSDSENELVKPMLSYIADNGDVKFKTRISSDDVAELLGEKESLHNKHQIVQLITREDEKNRPEVIVQSKIGGKQKHERHKKVFLREGISNHVLGNGKKELIFKPPGDKKISNLTVSFQIS